LRLLSWYICLQKIGKGLELGRQKVRNIENASALGKALADAFLLGEGVSHGNSGRMWSNVEPDETGKRKQTPLPGGRVRSDCLRLPFGGAQVRDEGIDRIYFTKHKRADGSTASPKCKILLLDFDLGASVFQLLLEGFCISLGNAFLDRLRSAVNQILGFLEAQAGNGTDDLDDFNLLVAASSENDGEFGLLFSSAAAAPAAGPATAIAAAETPNFSSNALTRSFSSITVMEPTASRMSSLLIAISNNS
jgi:hypothetical protein